MCAGNSLTKLFVKSHFALLTRPGMPLHRPAKEEPGPVSKIYDVSDPMADLQTRSSTRSKLLAPEAACCFGSKCFLAYARVKQDL